MKFKPSTTIMSTSPTIMIHEYYGEIKPMTMKYYGESKQFVLKKQLIFLEFQLKKMEGDFDRLLDRFGEDGALVAYGNDRKEYERLAALRDSLERLEALQQNLNALSPELLETLTAKPLKEGELLDAIIKSMCRPSLTTKKSQN